MKLNFKISLTIFRKIRKLMRSTIITAYFVYDALAKLRPYLASGLGGTENVRVITVGYEMGGDWEPSWVESVLGLTIFRYDMVGISRHPIAWRMDASEEDAGDGGALASGDGSSIGIGPSSSFGGADDAHDADRTLVADRDAPTTEEDLDAFLRRRREREMEELNAGLRIHHDERLDEFAGARWSSSLSSSSVAAGEDPEGEGWDFDETEDPVALMEESHRTMSKSRINVDLRRGRKKEKEEEEDDDARALPIWKKP